MKMNKKQIAWSDRKVGQALGKARVRLFMILLMAFAVPAVTFAVNDPSRDNIKVAAEVTGSGAVLAGMGLIGNISAVSDRESAGNQIGYIVWLIARDQIDTTVPFPAPNADREVGTITLKAGEYMHSFEAIKNTLKDTGTGEKGEITTDHTNTFTFIMGGNPVKLMDFLEEYSGSEFIIIYRECESTDYYILGNPCKSMTLKSYERKKDNEAKAVTLTFEGKSYRQSLKYVGNLVTAEPDTVAAAATNIPVTDNPQYRLSPNAAPAAIATVSGIASADYGRVIDILGITTGANPPTIPDSAVFVLIDAATFTGRTGSKISFRILDDATLVEVAGTRYQT
jgi:hypothetical protein